MKPEQKDFGESAVVVRRATKSYRAGQPVLDGLDMTVPCGSIYGLLGSSGCGKTTLLSALVGLTKLDQGDVWLFGHRPGGKGLGIPGRNVGYMPQDIALHPEFSIGETLAYFGTLAGMSKGEVLEKKKFFLNLLDLPDGSRRVGGLSGGQQRRVSLVAAMISGPELLILDEPTVGVDPLVRQSVWRYLKHLTRNQQTTVIITTHYIEECRDAHSVGIMRSGRLLKERRTDELMREYCTQNLEEIVLTLARREELAPSWKPALPPFPPPLPRMAEILNKSETGVGDSLARIDALTRKNIAKLRRNPMHFFFLGVVPAVVLSLVCIALSKLPHHLPLGLVNYEGTCFNMTQNGTTDGQCTLEMLSCDYLASLEEDRSTTLALEPFEWEEEALSAVYAGRTRGYLLFPAGFSSALMEKIGAGSDTKWEDMANSSLIKVKLDESNKLISGTITVALFQGFERFVRRMLNQCEVDPRQGESSLKFGPPLMGKYGGSFRDYVAPGLIIVNLFFFSLASSSLHLIRERKSGVLHRSLVAGVRTWEVMLAYSLSELRMILLQSILNYLVATQIFAVEVVGNSYLLLGLFVLTGYAGVAMGFLLGSVCPEEMQASLLAMAAFVPNMILTGVLWPPEGMTYWLQFVAKVLPITLPTEAARSITSRGWDWSHPHVWPGFVALAVHLIAYCILTVLFNVVSKR